MKNRNVLLILVFFLSFLQAYAIDCDEDKSYPDWRSSQGPIRDQDTIGWCYAFTASDLLTDFMNRNPDHRPKKLSNLDFTKKENMVSPMSGAVAVENGVLELSSTMKMNYDIDKTFSYEKVLENNIKLEKSQKDYNETCRNDCQHDCLYSYIHNLDYSHLKCDFFQSRSKDLPEIVKLFKKVEELDKKQRLDIGKYQRITMGGNAELILDYYIRSGFSLESQFPTDNFKAEDRLSQISHEFSLAFGTAKSKEQALCSGYELYKELCPNCTQTFEDIKPILEKSLNPQKSALYELTNNDQFKFNLSKSSKIDIKKFSYQEESELSEKRKNIDEGLTKGIVGIGYDISNILSLNKGGHASTLVGKKCIQGQEHYILRNSWGSQACEAEKKEIILGRIETAASEQEVAKKYSGCMSICNDMPTKIENSFSLFSQDDPKKVLEKKECKNSCYNKNKDELSQKFGTYECDKIGYYFIESEKILNATSSAQYLVPKN